MLPLFWLANLQITAMRTFKKDSMHPCSSNGFKICIKVESLKKRLNIEGANMNWYKKESEFSSIWPSKIDDYQFRNPLSFKDAKYLFWNFSSMLIYSFAWSLNSRILNVVISSQLSTLIMIFVSEVRNKIKLDISMFFWIFGANNISVNILLQTVAQCVYTFLKNAIIWNYERTFIL